MRKTVGESPIGVPTKGTYAGAQTGRWLERTKEINVD